MLSSYEMETIYSIARVLFLIIYFVAIVVSCIVYMCGWAVSIRRYWDAIRKTWRRMAYRFCSAMRK